MSDLNERISGATTPLHDGTDNRRGLGHHSTQNLPSDYYCYVKCVLDCDLSMAFVRNYSKPSTRADVCFDVLTNRMLTFSRCASSSLRRRRMRMDRRNAHKLINLPFASRSTRNVSRCPAIKSTVVWHWKWAHNGNMRESSFKMFMIRSVEKCVKCVLKIIIEYFVWFIATLYRKSSTHQRMYCFAIAQNCVGWCACGVPHIWVQLGWCSAA